MKNREIKFRAWDNDSKSFLKGDFSLGIESGQFRSKYGDVYKNVELLQFTGLKDKNGVDIYEGDVVKHIIKSDFLDKSDWKEITGEVVTINGCLCVKTEIYPLFAFENLAIGNIYQNPEILK